MLKVVNFNAFFTLFVLLRKWNGYSLRPKRLLLRIQTNFLFYDIASHWPNTKENILFRWKSSIGMHSSTPDTITQLDRNDRPETKETSKENLADVHVLAICSRITQKCGEKNSTILHTITMKQCEQVKKGPREIRRYLPYQHNVIGHSNWKIHYDQAHN